MNVCLNRDHLTARSLVELAGLRFGLVDDMRKEIAAGRRCPWPPGCSGPLRRATVTATLISSCSSLLPPTPMLGGGKNNSGG